MQYWNKYVTDNVNQVLTSCSMQIRSASRLMPGGEAKDMIEDAQKTIKGAMSDIRLLSHSLNTGMVEHRETEEAIQHELDRLQAFANVQCSLDADTMHDLQPEQRLLVFRIVQEALQNIIKHAAATTIQVKITSTEEQYQLSITDDGKGFDTNAASASLGLVNMKERATMLKGDLRFISSPGQGTTLHLQIPITQHNDTHSNSTG